VTVSIKEESKKQKITQSELEYEKMQELQDQLLESSH
jgi:hypothetical protein